jgi:hypothetical protein
MRSALLTLAIMGLVASGTLFAADATNAKPRADKAAPKAAKPPAEAVKTPPPGPAPSDKGFCFKDTAGEYFDVYLDGRAVARYMYANDTSTPQRAHETFKPYLHVFDAEGKGTITKGPGGQFTHHRGIFFGWKRIDFEGKQYNLWEMGGNRQIHQKFLDQKAGPDQASFTSLVSWNLADGKTIIQDERTFTFHRRPAPTLALIDFSSKVKGLAGDLDLNGDPEHGGIQFRPAEEVDRKTLKYCLPKDAVEPPHDPNAEFQTMKATKIAKTDLPWAAESYQLGGKTYNVEEMSGPGNPTGTRWSAYRDYGRFGAFPALKLKAGDTATFRYRFWVTSGDAPTRADLQKQYDEYMKAAAPK